MTRAARPPAPHLRLLLAAAMAAPVLIQLALHGLLPPPAGRAGTGAQVAAYAASCAAALLACVLVARLEAARTARRARAPARKD